MFTQKCFIRKSTSWLAESIYKLGGRYCSGFWNENSSTVLAAHPSYYKCYDILNNDCSNLIKNGFIDCGTNEELFLAIAALRDDTDKNQWFTNGEIYTISEYDKFCYGAFLYNGKGFSLIDIADRFHKATVEELINRYVK